MYYNLQSVESGTSMFPDYVISCDYDENEARKIMDTLFWLSLACKYMRKLVELIFNSVVGLYYLKQKFWCLKNNGLTCRMIGAIQNY